MGSLTPGSADLATNVVKGVFNAAGQSASLPFVGSFNAMLWGAWLGSTQLERSPDGGTTWIICGIGGGGQEAIYTGPPISLVVTEPEPGILYRWNCTLLSSGSANYRLSGSSLPPGWFYNGAGVLVRSTY